MARVAVVTGAAGDIGRACAAAFSADHVLILLDQKMPVLPAGSEGMCHALDLTKPDEVAAAFASVKDRWGHVDALVNVAGIKALLHKWPEGRTSPFPGRI